MTINVPQVHVSNLSGVPAYWSPVEGPTTAMLRFGGGVCVEPVHQRGIQHLMEHLILTEVGPQVHDYNGFVDLRTMTFIARGSADEVRNFFEVVMAGITQLPTGRRSLEPGVLGAEAERAVPSTYTNLLGYMFGLAGPGLLALPEIAVGSLESDDLRAWTDQYLNASNAAFVSSCDPSFVDLSPLPSGDPVSEWTLPPPIDGPGWIGGNGSGFAAVAICPRSTAMTTMIRVLRDHLMDHMRYRSGLGYSIDVIYDPLTISEAAVGVFVDAQPERRFQARNALFEALDEFTEQGPERRWLELDAGRLARSHQELHAGLATANQAAMRQLLGEADPLDDSWRDEYRSLQPGDLSEAASTFVEKASWQMPNDAPMPPWRWLPRLKTFSTDPIDGRDLVPAKPINYRMIAGTDGLSVIHGPDRIANIKFEDIAVAEAEPNGERVLHAHDGTRIVYDSAQWAEDHEFETWLDERISAPILHKGT